MGQILIDPMQVDFEPDVPDDTIIIDDPLPPPPEEY